MGHANTRREFLGALGVSAAGGMVARPAGADAGSDRLSIDPEPRHELSAAAPAPIP